MTTITVLNAGLRAGGSTKVLADLLADALRAHQPSDLTLHRVNLRDHAHAITDALLTGFAAGELAEVMQTTTRSDALVVVTPVFQASYSGLFKSFMDLVEPGSLSGTPVLLAATGGSERHSLVLDHALRPLFSYLGADPISTGVYAATSDFGPGAVDLGARVDRAVTQLLQWTIPRSQPAIAGSAPRGQIMSASAERSRELPEGVLPFAEMLTRYST